MVDIAFLLLIFYMAT
ncbi:MAG: hypothetical protein NDJ18_07125, partial [candidate division Zixibacteria bacterium]|nr:hypothetical protein [candidate division Zixibacteria bacterium]